MSPNIKDQPVHSILLLEDDSPMARLIERVLTRQGYQVRVEASARAGLENIKRYGIPHAAIVDIHMPDLDLKRNSKEPGGLAFCRAISQFCDIPVIIVTADNTVDSILTFIQNYADDYIAKPFDPRELNARIDAKDSERLFQEFERLDPKHPGSGLGLPISRKLVALHKGSIAVRNREPQGSCFTICLPFTENNA